MPAVLTRGDLIPASTGPSSHSLTLTTSAQGLVQPSPVRMHQFSPCGPPRFMAPLVHAPLTGLRPLSLLLCPASPLSPHAPSAVQLRAHPGGRARAPPQQQHAIPTVRQPCQPRRAGRVQQIPDLGLLQVRHFTTAHYLASNERTRPHTHTQPIPLPFVSLRRHAMHVDTGPTSTSCSTTTDICHTYACTIFFG